MRLTDEQIGVELRALREAPSERFSAELDRRVADAFPSEGPDAFPSEGPKASAGWRDFGRLRALPRRPVLAGAAAILVAIVVAVGALQSNRDEGITDFGPTEKPTAESGRAGGAATQQAPSAAAERAPSDAIAPEPTTVPPSPPVPPDEQLKPGHDRVKEQTASMSLSTEPDQVADVADGVIEVTERYDGIVVSSNVSTSDAGGRASFDLRIPSQNLRAALADLSDLADVTSRDEGALDITAPFVTAEERFTDAKAEVDALLEQLSEADSAAEIASIRQQLQLARGELAAARSSLGALKQRADFSRLSVTVAGNGDGDGWSIGDAADDAVDVLEALGGAALVTLAVLVPLGALAALLWLGTARIRQRRRESALDRS